MQSITIDPALAFILIIPFHGFFLSLFFIMRSGWNLNANYFMGLLLFILSSLVFYQSFCLRHEYVVLNASEYYLFLNELLIAPFLFLYNSVVIQPAVQLRIYLHLLAILSVFLTFILSRVISGPIFLVSVIIFIIINGLYLGGTTRLLMLLLTNKIFCSTIISDYPGIIIFNLLVTGSFFISSFFYMILPDNTISLVQVSKAPVIYYLYRRILNKADLAK